MFVVRFLLLVFLVAYGLSIGQELADQLNNFGNLMVLSLFVTAPALYLLPTYEAWKNRHPNLGAIALVNIFLGWALVGWVVALVWAFKRPVQVNVNVQSLGAETLSTPARILKKCPFCAEEILMEAIKCKHCGSDLEAEK